jgi:hypothetical protein
LTGTNIFEELNRIAYRDQSSPNLLGISSNTLREGVKKSGRGEECVHLGGHHVPAVHASPVEHVGGEISSGLFIRSTFSSSAPKGFTNGPVRILPS